MEYQQNFVGLSVAVVIIETASNDITVLRSLMPAVLEVLPRVRPGTVTRVGG